MVLEGEAVIAGGTSPGLVAEAERLSAQRRRLGQAVGRGAHRRGRPRPPLGPARGPCLRRDRCPHARATRRPGQLPPAVRQRSAPVGRTRCGARLSAPGLSRDALAYLSKRPERAALGSRSSSRNVERALRALRTVAGTGPSCALEDCDHPVPRAGALYCSCPAHPSHQDLAKKRRKRALPKPADTRQPENKGEKR